MPKGNYNSSIFPQEADRPKQEGQGENTPKGVKAARAYTGAKATGKKPSNSDLAVK